MTAAHVHLFLLGVSHRTAPVDLRERLDFSSRDVGAAVEALATRSSAAESVVLSTCNRSEIYVASTEPARAREEMIAFLSDYHQLPRDAFLPHLFVHDDTAAAHHLFRVAAGLDSLVVGEPQILGQVKDAFQAAAERHCTGPLLSKTFHWAFGVGKRVRSRDGARRRRRVGQLRRGRRSRERFSAASRAAACWSSAPARSAR